MDEGFVAVEQTMASGEKVSLEPPLALVLRQHFDHLALWGEVVIGVEALRLPLAVGCFEDGLQTIGGGLIGAEDPEPVPIGTHDVVAGMLRGRPRVASENVCVPGGDFDPVGAEVGQIQILEQQPAVGSRVGAHAPVPFGCERRQRRYGSPTVVEELCVPVATHPHFELLEVRRIRAGPRPDMACL